MVDDTQWRDPLLLTDASTQHQKLQPLNGFRVCSGSKGSQSPSMADALGRPRRRSISAVRFTDPVESDICNGQSMLGFSLHSPDLVVCSDSPLPPKPSYEDSPECLKNEIRKEMATSIVLSLEEGIDCYETNNTRTISSNWSSCKEDVSSEASFELVPQQTDHVDCEESVPVISVNAGGEKIEVDAASYLEDHSFHGGEVIRTNFSTGVGESVPLYQTARFGNFLYRFRSDNAT